MTKHLLLSVLVLSLMLPFVAAATQSSGAVYVMTNNSSGNTILQFKRHKTGLLTLKDQVSTGGLGSEGSVDPLTSQDSLVLAGDLLLAVNAGSDEVSVLGTTKKGLTLLSKAASGGDFPNSIAISGDLVYVLNAHDTPNIQGFRLDSDGTLEAIPGSARNLPGGTSAAPSDIKFSLDGTRLIVTESGTKQIDVFQLDNTGLVSGVTTSASNGLGPFGFQYGPNGSVLVSEARSAALSSYSLTNTNTVQVISGSIANGQTASCWLSVTNDRKTGYVSNTGSGTISSYGIDSDGVVTLQNAVAANTGGGSAPIDSAFSNDSGFLYVIDSALGRVLIFKALGADLEAIGSVTDLPTSIQGIAAR